MNNDASEVRRALRVEADPIKSGILSGFFKTGPGEYGEGDIFLGVTVPKQRAIAKKFIGADLQEISSLLQSKIHEERLIALLILTYQYPKASKTEKENIYNFYLDHLIWINNWDLVDATCPNILGAWLRDNDRGILYKLAKSQNIWERRMSVLACFYFIKMGEVDDILLISEKLLNDKHDLIHKAVGWMLREMGKRCDENILKAFLNEHATKMPRTMLRYAIERLPEDDRKYYLSRKV